MSSDQQINYANRSSLTFNFQQQSGQFDDPSQPRSFSVPEASFGNSSFAEADGRSFYGRNDQDAVPQGYDSSWPDQQQRACVDEGYPLLNNINNIILDKIAPVIQNHSSTDAPWYPQGSQQREQQRFNVEQYRTHGFGAATVVPDLRSRDGSFAHDSAYYSQSSRKQSAPSEGKGQAFGAQLPSPSHVSRPKAKSSVSPGSVVSDDHLHKKFKRAAVTKKTLQCPEEGCMKNNLKNQSDLEKHVNQHKRPYLCTEPACHRAQEGSGFGTTNDRERHRASVHKLKQNSGNTTGYICFACEQIRPARKWWPRKDNFTSHIRRKHSDWTVAKLLEVSSHQFRPVDANTEIPSAVSHHGNPEDLFDHRPSWSPAQPTQQADMFFPTHGNEGEMLADTGQWASSMASNVWTDGVQLSDMKKVQPDHGHIGTSDLNFEMPSAASTHMPATFNAPALRLMVPFRDEQPQELDMMGWDRVAAASQSQSGSTQDTGQPVKGHKCSRCPKVTKRACDLRKHEKRHTRPYGCTQPQCFRTFGSRNDWKRHEEKLHSLREQWRCQLPTANGGPCSKLFNNQEQISEHLDTRHGNEGYHHDSPFHWDAIDAFHIGKERHQTFWCGFCNDLVSRRKEPHQHGVDIRLQHIGDHFDKDRRMIDDWVDLEENKQKRFLSPPKPTTEDSRGLSSDGSDLGDDGIPDPAVFVSAEPSRRSTRFARRNMYNMARNFMNGEEDVEGESDRDYSQRMR